MIRALISKPLLVVDQVPSSACSDKVGDACAGRDLVMSLSVLGLLWDYRGENIELKAFTQVPG